MSNLRKILQAMEELHKKHPQPFMHIIQKYCTHKEPQQQLLGASCVGYRHVVLEVVSFYPDEAILWLLVNDKPNPKVNLPIFTKYVNDSRAMEIFDKLRELDAAQDLDKLYKSFEDFVWHNCIMSYPADGDCNDYYEYDFDVLDRINWELENP